MAKNNQLTMKQLSEELDTVREELQAKSEEIAAVYRTMAELQQVVDTFRVHHVETARDIEELKARRRSTGGGTRGPRIVPDLKWDRPVDGSERYHLRTLKRGWRVKTEDAVYSTLATNDKIPFDEVTRHLVRNGSEKLGYVTNRDRADGTWVIEGHDDVVFDSPKEAFRGFVMAMTAHTVDDEENKKEDDEG
jgi:hypothetical protein